MYKLYQKREVLFAVGWILVYCLVLAPIRGRFGDASPWMLLALLAVAAVITVFVKRNHLEKKYGLKGWPKDAKRYLHFLPMLLLATGNVWDGFEPSEQGLGLVFAVLSMLVVGYVEEMIFRGFLFRAMLPESGVKVSIIVVALTFGVGHFVNLFTGQATWVTVMQVLFAVAWGFLFTMAFYKSESMLPGVLAHSLNNALSLFGRDTTAGDWAYIGTTIVVSLVYCLFLAKLPEHKAVAAQTE
ncbi:MAG: CPBP family intramembrane metalloprotease [Ruminococcaceae bacterium]|nr:CPBP family intramembrane metalloprotease [Oscillospiraceae bacterium]